MSHCSNAIENPLFIAFPIFCDATNTATNCYKHVATALFAEFFHQRIGTLPGNPCKSCCRRIIIRQDVPARQHALHGTNGGTLSQHPLLFFIHKPYKINTDANYEKKIRNRQRKKEENLDKTISNHTGRALKLVRSKNPSDTSRAGGGRSG